MKSNMSRSKRLFLSTGMTLTNQLVTAVSGLILPVYILNYFGSAVNGLVSSITQFLSLISLIELGVGAVVQSNLYKPLAENDIEQISKVYISAERFYRRIAFIFLAYVAVLVIFYPVIANSEFSFLYTASMVLILAIGTFAQYFFGLANQTLLGADQKSYIYLILQTVSVVLNLVFCVIFIRLGAGIHIVRLTTSIVYLLRPFGTNLYVRNHYHLDKKIVIDEEPIKQKWNGFSQHVANVVLHNTDVMVLTVFSSLENVSIYTVYYNVVRVIKDIIESTANNATAFIGSLMFRDGQKRLSEFFTIFEWEMHTVVVYFFTVTGILVTPFVKIYTKGVTDADYYQPMFGIALCVALASFCLRMPYNMLVKAAGHYKETQKSAWIEMFINLTISILVVRFRGLIGVAVGTICSMLYRSIYLAIYSSKYILNRSCWKFIKRWVIDIFSVVMIILSTFWINLDVSEYWEWIMEAMVVAGTTMVVILIINALFSRYEITQSLNYLRCFFVRKNDRV